MLRFIRENHSSNIGLQVKKRKEESLLYKPMKKKVLDIEWGKAVDCYLTVEIA